MSLVAQSLRKSAAEKKTDDGYGPTPESGPFAKQKKVVSQDLIGRQYSKSAKDSFKEVITGKKIEPKKDESDYPANGLKEFKRRGKVSTPGSPGFWEK